MNDNIVLIWTLEVRFANYESIIRFVDNIHESISIRLIRGRLQSLLAPFRSIFWWKPFLCTSPKPQMIDTTNLFKFCWGIF